MRALALFFVLSGAWASDASAKSILFVGNSFTFGSLSPVMEWGSSTVTDLNGDGMGGVPALFKRFSEQAGRRDKVSLETGSGKSLEWHWTDRRKLLDRPWDEVVLQQYSTIDPDQPGNPEKLVKYSGLLSRMFRARNPKARIGLVATWSRPDQTFPAEGHWSGQPIEKMALDVRRADELARRSNPEISRIYPVGEAFNCAIAVGLADPNPYDGIDAGKINLWAPDHYHASTAGYYLEALTIFAGVTGVDPRTLGRKESAAAELGLPANVAIRLQAIAYSMVLGKGCASR